MKKSYIVAGGAWVGEASTGSCVAGLGQLPIAILHPNVRGRERKDWAVGKASQPADVSFGHCRQLDRITATARRPKPRGLAESAATKANDLWGLIVHGVVFGLESISANAVYLFE